MAERDDRFDWLRKELKRAEDDRTGRRALLDVALGCAIVAIVGWFPLGVLPNTVTALLGRPTCTAPAGSGGSPLLYLCSARVALNALVGPLVILLIATLYREHLARAIRRGVTRAPATSRFLIAPVVATALFTASWAGAHWDSPFIWGLVPEIVFPAVAGVFAYLVGRYDPYLQQRLATLLERRDRYPRRIRFVVAIAVPLVVSLILTFGEPVAQATLKEQLIVVLGLVCGYLALVPRHGALMTALHDLNVPKARSRPATRRAGL
jgi:hypothetical protein